MANIYKAYKGAVEPAASGASGNEYQAWKGAVEPVGAAAAFAGTTAGDGGYIWPPRSNDPRWAQFITDSGITASGNFIDDVHAALEAMASTTGQMDDLWLKVKEANGVTDTSEPYLY
jgi:hypothetical protein